MTVSACTSSKSSLVWLTEPLEARVLRKKQVILSRSNINVIEKTWMFCEVIHTQFTLISLTSPCLIKIWAQCSGFWHCPALFLVFVVICPFLSCFRFNLRLFRVARFGIWSMLMLLMLLPLLLLYSLTLLLLSSLSLLSLFLLLWLPSMICDCTYVSLDPELVCLTTSFSHW